MTPLLALALLTAADPGGVAVHKDLAYYAGPDADPVRHKLDVYAPKDAKGRPVVLFVHGGTWRSGGKVLYTGLGRHLAQRGYVAAVANYRLSPKVKHPEHARDVARAVAWLHDHAAAYGGRPDRLVLCGHSAGGHLCALIACDDQYLKAEGRSPKDVCGVVGISGVYEIPPGRLFAHAFGTDEKVCAAASPVNHVCAGLPPFLLLYADHDFPKLDVMAKSLGDKLTAAKVAVTVKEVPQRSHISIISKMALAPDDEVTGLVDEFVKRCAGP